MAIDASASDREGGLTMAFAIATITTISIFVYDKFIKKSNNSPIGPSVRQLNIYPIKSCAEMQVLKASVTPRGFQYDRIFQVVSKPKEGDKAWMICTPRIKAFEKLFHLKGCISADGKSMTLSSPHSKSGKFTLELEGSNNSSLLSKVMGYNEFSLEDYGDDVASWIECATGSTTARLVGIPANKNYNRRVDVNPYQGDELPSTASEKSKPYFPMSLGDEAPFLLTSNESLVELNKCLKLSGKDEVDMRRFRPNIVIDGLKPWEEDTLKRIRIGTTEFHVWQRCGRCALTTIDRDTLHRCGELLTTLSTFRERENGQRNFGMHLIPVVEGKDGNAKKEEIMVGDEVEILEYDEERKAEWMRLFNSNNGGGSR